MPAYARTKGVIVIEGHEITITNPDKPLWPKQGITKAMYLEKLALLAPYLLPYCRNRHLTTIRYPHGEGDKSFYQKNCPEPAPAFVRTAQLDGINYVVLDSLPTLLWLGNLACLEFHPSLHYIGETLPAEWLIDIDPSVDPEPRIMEAAQLVGEVLDSLGIQSIAKTSGATGVQIWVPLDKTQGYTFEQLRRIGQLICRYLTAKHPHIFTLERMTKNRGSLIYLDYMQHWYGKTLAAPYTPRAKPFATVSTPLEWAEVALRPDLREFNLLTVTERLLHKGDLIAAVPPQRLDAVLDAIR
ncbi:non-homologous end-joining DNA ligase [Paenibacillus sp. y28]|uniref:non-homologous end-joining DNA ligase n=1 Tax=Paenibacillus sp. y28 TaxID=3129110 RepID=UPI003019BB13